jgi:hypothetical protein
MWQPDGVCSRVRWGGCLIATGVSKTLANRNRRRGRRASTAGSRSDADDAQIACSQDGLHRSAIFRNLLHRYKELPECRGNLTTHMDVRDNSRYLRPAVLFVILLLHGSLIVFLLRAKPAYKAWPASAPLSTIFFINPEPRLTLRPPSETAVIPHGSGKDLRHRGLSDSSSSSVDTTSPSENQAPTAPSTIDWFAEAQRSAAEIAGRDKPDRAALSSPTGPAPWDPHPHLLEATGHGLKLRIPVRIPLQLIDHCFSDIDLGQTPYGPEERLQLGCALKKQPARGDLFDSLRKPQPPQLCPIYWRGRNSLRRPMAEIQ